MKIAILGTVHPKGLEFLKNNEFEVFEVEDRLFPAQGRVLQRQQNGKPHCGSSCDA